MMDKLVARGEQIAAQAQAIQVNRVAQRLRAMFGSPAVTTEEAQVMVSGRGLARRWLTDPSVRFLGGGLK